MRNRKEYVLRQAARIHVDPWGMRGIDETPECVARGGSPATLESGVYKGCGAEKYKKYEINTALTPHFISTIG